jgi:UDP-GlcNAc:undecaprenyl-phosphate GlcNAc-1-phosphate transferase
VSIRHLAVLILVAGLVTLAATPIVRRIAIRFGWVVRGGGRKVHSTPVPQLGGVAIFLGIIGAFVFEVVGEARFGWTGGLASGSVDGANLFGVFGGLALVFLVGLLDDVYDLAPGVKLAGQIAAGILVAASGLRIDYVGNPLGRGLIMLGLLSIPATVAYLVGFANVINLIDGLDGLAAGVTAIAATSLLVLAAQGNRYEAAALAAAIIGACLGFLRFNFSPASIFMGDSGAMLLGFALATVSLLGVMKTTVAIALAVPLLIVGVPIFDTISAIVRRVKSGRPIQEADRGHIHHRLLTRGFDTRQTVLILYVWSAALGAGAYAVRYAPGPLRWAALISLFAVTAFMAYWLGLLESAHHHEDDAL